MTRAQIVAAAASHLGDSSAEFLTILDGYFDEVLRDLARDEAIELLRREHVFDLVADQENYSTRTMTVLSAPYYPLRVLNIWVPTWGAEGILQKANTDDEFMYFRQTTDPQTLKAGRIRMWQVYPNHQQIRVWPTTDAANSGVGLGSIKYIGPPSIIASNDVMDEIRYEDLDTITYGLIFKGAPFRDETLSDVDKAAAIYQQGKAAMWARTHNGYAGRTDPQDF